MAEAGTLKSPYQHATAEKFWDWKYAQHVWTNLNTWEKQEAEWAKCEADWDPWFASYKQDARRALDALDKLPKAKRKSIQRCYDIQLAFDHWWDHVYSPWYNGYPHAASMASWKSAVNKRQITAPTFDDMLEAYNQRQTCHPNAMLDECGPVPDWRWAEWRTKEQEMMQKSLAEIEANRKAKSKR